MTKGSTIKGEVDVASPSSPVGILAPDPAAPTGLLPIMCKFCDPPKVARYKNLELCHTHYVRKRRGAVIDKPVRHQLKSLSSTCSYEAAHTRCRLLWGPADRYRCAFCGSTAAQWAYDGCDPSEQYGYGSPASSNGVSYMAYSAWPEFYIPLCKACHRKLDGVGENDGW